MFLEVPAGDAQGNNLQPVFRFYHLALVHHSHINTVMTAMQVLLCTANQYISAYTQVVTSTTALSVQAAGIQIGLPAEIGRLLAFLEQTVEASGKGRQLLKQFLPPFLLDNWQCLVLSEKSL